MRIHELIGEADVIPFPNSPKPPAGATAPQASVPSVPRAPSEPAARTNPWTAAAAGDAAKKAAETVVDMDKVSKVMSEAPMKKLMWKVVGKLVFGYGAYSDAKDIWTSLSQGDWRSASALTLALGMNLGEVFGVIAGPAGLAASFITQIAATLYSYRSLIFELHYERDFKTNDPTDEAMAVALVPYYAKAIYNYFNDQYIKMTSNLPTNAELDEIADLYMKKARATNKEQDNTVGEVIRNRCKQIAARTHGNWVDISKAGYQRMQDKPAQ
jgi:hypothetical protein